MLGRAPDATGAVRERRELHELVAREEPGAGDARAGEAHVAAEADPVVLRDARAGELASTNARASSSDGAAGGAPSVAASSASSA